MATLFKTLKMTGPYQQQLRAFLQFNFLLRPTDYFSKLLSVPMYPPI